MEKHNKRYGSLLENVMEKKTEDPMIKAAEKFTELFMEGKRKEEERRMAFMELLEEKEEEERDRIQHSCAMVEAMLDKYKEREKKKAEEREAEKREAEDAERRRTTIANLNWTPK